METIMRQASAMLIRCMTMLLLFGWINAHANAQTAYVGADGKQRLDMSGYRPPDPDVIFAEKNKGAVSAGFSLRAEAETPIVTHGQPITLTLTLRNCTNETLRVVSGTAEVHHLLDVKNATGERLSVKDHGVCGGGSRLVWVRPGEELVSKYPLNKIYHILTPGQYFITASRLVYLLDGEGFADVVSNTVGLTVSDDQQDAQASAGPAIKTENTTTAESDSENAKPRLVAVRPLLERHSCELAWDARTGTALVTRNGLRATLQANSYTMIVAGREVKMSTPAKLMRGQLYAPADALSQITEICRPADACLTVHRR